MLRYSLVLATLSLLPACPLLDAQAKVEQACVTYPGVAVDGAPPGTAQLDTSFTIDQLDSLKTLAQQGFQLDLVHGEVRAVSGITSFSFVDHASVSVASGDPASTLPTLDAFDCQSCGSDSATLTLPPFSTANLAPYVESGSLVVGLSFAGRPPESAWSVDVDVCVSGTATYSLDP